MRLYSSKESLLKLPMSTALVVERVDSVRLAGPGFPPNQNFMKVSREARGKSE